MKNLCLYCGNLTRPILYLNDVEKMELERLVGLGDWRAWAKKVLEHSEPKKLANRELLNDILTGKIDNEECVYNTGPVTSEKFRVFTELGADVGNGFP